MTEQQKLKNYKDYTEAEIEMQRIPMKFDDFIESLTVDGCEGCKKLGETICGNDMNLSCFEPITE
jgi:hypothetical protein